MTGDWIYGNKDDDDDDWKNMELKTYRNRTMSKRRPRTHTVMRILKPRKAISYLTNADMKINVHERNLPYVSAKHDNESLHVHSHY